MKTKVEKVIKESLNTNEDYQDFFNFLGIDPKDFEETDNDVNFDDYSN